MRLATDDGVVGDEVTVVYGNGSRETLEQVLRRNLFPTAVAASLLGALR